MNSGGGACEKTRFFLPRSTDVREVFALAVIFRDISLVFVVVYFFWCAQGTILLAHPSPSNIDLT